MHSNSQIYRRVNPMKEVKLSRKNRILTGVCGGIGEAYDIDPNLVRLAWIAFTVLTYVVLGVALYIIATVLLPEQDKDEDVIEAEYQVRE
jgi:phage shock protein C